MHSNQKYTEANINDAQQARNLPCNEQTMKQAALQQLGRVTTCLEHYLSKGLPESRRLSEILLCNSQDLTY